jgi:hypothetical protein
LRFSVACLQYFEVIYCTIKFVDRGYTHKGSECFSGCVVVAVVRCGEQLTDMK